MKSPTWIVNKPAPWGTTYGEYARLKGYVLRVALWKNQYVKAVVEYRGAPGHGWITAAEHSWWAGNPTAALREAREWCVEIAYRPKAKAEG